MHGGEGGREGAAAYLRASVTIGFWFVPGIMLVGAIAPSFITLYLDRRFIGAHAAAAGWLMPTGTEGTRRCWGPSPASIADSTVESVDRRDVAERLQSLDEVLKRWGSR